MKDVQQRMTLGALWMLLFKAVERSISIVTTLILARLLAPADFGIMAMAMAFIALAELLTAFAFDVALIHNQSASRQHYDTAWTCNVLFGALITVVLLVAAEPIALFYDTPDVMWVVFVLAFGPVIGSLENIGVVAFRKDLDFRREFVFQVSKKVLGFCIIVPLALWFRSYWALIIGSIIGRFSGVAFSYAMHPFRPKLSLEKFQELFGFSRWMLLINVAVFVRERMTSFIVGRSLGAHPLGLFNISNEFSNLTLTELAAPLNRALLPGFAKMQGNKVATADTFFSATGLLALIALPAAFGLSAVSPVLVPVLLGDKWLEAIHLMEVLAVSGGIVAFQSPICALLIGHGKPEHVMWGHVSFIVIALIGMWFLISPFGLLGVAYSLLIASALSMPVFLWLLNGAIGISPLRFGLNLVRPLSGALLMWVVVRHFQPDPATSAQSMWTMVAALCMSLVVGVTTYVIAMLALWTASGRPDGSERIAIGWIAAKLRLAAAS